MIMVFSISFNSVKSSASATYFHTVLLRIYLHARPAAPAPFAFAVCHGPQLAALSFSEARPCLRNSMRVRSECALFVFRCAAAIAAMVSGSSWRATMCRAVHA